MVVLFEMDSVAQPRTASCGWPRVEWIRVICRAALLRPASSKCQKIPPEIPHVVLKGMAKL